MENIPYVLEKNVLSLLDIEFYNYQLGQDGCVVLLRLSFY